MIMHVVERARKARLVSRVIVATDDFRIAEAVQSAGGEAKLTSADASSGTDRVAEVAGELDCDIIANIQGDEPLIDPSTIDAAIQPLLDDPALQISTTSEPIIDIEDVFNPNVVKVVTDMKGFALYFSRSPIPYIRSATGTGLEQRVSMNPDLISKYRKHSGLYVYRKSFLKLLTGIEPSSLELLESLEQLRALENGFKIRVVAVDHRSIGVDTIEDYEKVKRIIEESN